MMSKLIPLFLASVAIINHVNARCDNQCSGHGTCMTDDVCQCYDNFGSGLSHDSGDCSDRICPFEIAWVDTPNAYGRFHKYMECAGKGVCDRSTGECQCFDGFEGKGCARAACPNSCSGHGNCEYIEDLTYGATWNDHVDTTNATTTAMGTVAGFSDDSKSYKYNLWDKTKSRKCVCDAAYGDLDCSKRLCPYGTDVLDTKDDTYLGLEAQKHQEQTILLASLTGDFDGFDTKTFALTFKSQLNETFTTTPIKINTASGLADTENDIKLSLLKLPNGVIDGVTVKVDLVKSDTLEGLLKTLGTYTTPKSIVRGANVGPNNIFMGGNDRTVLWSGVNHRRLTVTDTAYMVIKIRFTGSSVQGPQNFLIVEDYLCGDGCTPKLTGLPVETRQTMAIWSSIVEITKSDYNSYECGRRGKCDYASGLCQCFAGYIGDNCNTLTTLV